MLNQKKRFFSSELFIIIICSIIFLAIAIGKDKERCEKNGGVYIWEWSYGNKCHLVEKVGEDKE